MQDLLETFDTPILLIAYNRPNHLRVVIKEVSKIKPKKLYISFDSPKNNDKENEIKCKETRKLLKDIDWDCKLKVRYSKKNLGCKLGVSKAISWFFENVDEGIILEDDCVPSKSFFHFMKNLLEKYRNDYRVMSISGTNPLKKTHLASNDSYFFSIYGSIWGWATWKRAWDKYDVSMKSWNDNFNKLAVKNAINNNIQYLFRKKVFNLSYNGNIDTWDYAWSYCRIINSGLTIIPKYNLIKNIGFGDEATHTKSKFNAYYLQKRFDVKFPLNHPDAIVPNRIFDSKYFLKNSIYSYIYSLLNIPIIIFNKIKRKI